MYRVTIKQVKASRHTIGSFQSMRSAWAGGLHLRSRADRRGRAGGNEVNKLEQRHSIYGGYETHDPCYSRLFR